MQRNQAAAGIDIFGTEKLTMSKIIKFHSKEETDSIIEEPETEAHSAELDRVIWENEAKLRALGIRCANVEVSEDEKLIRFAPIDD